MTNCPRCRGNGEIIIDESRYLYPLPGDVGDESVADCPDCDGSGVTEEPKRRLIVGTAEGDYPIVTSVAMAQMLLRKGCDVGYGHVDLDNEPVPTDPRYHGDPISELAEGNRHERRAAAARRRAIAKHEDFYITIDDGKIRRVGRRDR